MRRRCKRELKPMVIRPWSFGKCPTAEELRTAWRVRRKSQADFIAFLSLLGELICFTDCNLIQKGGYGNIGGRAGGLKAFLQREAPDLVPKYKSISRHATLATRIKIAFDIFPPAALSLMHPDLPLPKRNMPFLTNHCRKVYRDYFANTAPTYVAFNNIVALRLAHYKPKHAWGPALPQEKWEAAETFWRRKLIRNVICDAIQADHSFYARDYRGMY